MFSVCAACAVGSSKVNLLLQFEQPPSAAMVMSRAISAFTQLQQDRGVHTPFFCNCAMIFDDPASKWVPLERSAQIVHNCQLYLFQPDVPDVAGPIPDPMPAANFLVGYRSPARGSQHGASPRGLMPQDPDLSRFTQPPSVPRTYNTANLSSYSQQYESGDSYASSNGRGLSAAQRDVFHREADRVGAPYVSGDSILKQEREKEDAKVRLPVDEHRNRVRDETRRFSQEVSPQRGDRRA